jgi:hypothetical protein
MIWLVVAVDQSKRRDPGGAFGISLSVSALSCSVGAGAVAGLPWVVVRFGGG